MTVAASCLVLRLAGPLQSWGSRGQFNRRDTHDEPTKSGILGLLAAAQGLRRQDPLDTLLGLQLGVRVDQPGTLLRDYHTVSDYRGRPLPSAAVNAKGVQKPTLPAKYTHVTNRFYLQDAVFVAAISGPDPLLHTLAQALRSPAFPLALGRRSCPPTLPLVLTQDATHRVDAAPLWPGEPLDVLRNVPWQATATRQPETRSPAGTVRPVDLPVTVDDPDGTDIRMDVPRSFDPLRRGFDTRRIRQEWIRLGSDTNQTSTGPDSPAEHDPFTLLGW